jgi:hypothetical protein
MKFKPSALITLFILLLMACGGNYEYWDISNFKMDGKALEDDEKIQLLYSMSGPDHNRDLRHFNHLIVVSQKSGDTVNVLSFVNHGISMDDMGEIFVFYSRESQAAKFIERKLIVDQDDANSERYDHTKIDKVIRDPKYDHIADNDYPTVIGVIGKSAPITE